MSCFLQRFWLVLAAILLLNSLAVAQTGPNGGISGGTHG